MSWPSFPRDIPNGGKPPAVPAWKWYGGLPPDGFLPVVPGGGHCVVKPIVGGSQKEKAWPLGKYGLPASAAGRVPGAVNWNLEVLVETDIAGPAGAVWFRNSI